MAIHPRNPYANLIPLTVNWTDDFFTWSRKLLVESGISVQEVKENLSEWEDIAVENMCFAVNGVIVPNWDTFVDETHVMLIDMSQPKRCACCDKKLSPHEAVHSMPFHEAQKRKANMKALDRHVADMHPEMKWTLGPFYVGISGSRCAGKSSTFAPESPPNAPPRVCDNEPDNVDDQSIDRNFQNRKKRTLGEIVEGDEDEKKRHQVELEAQAEPEEDSRSERLGRAQAELDDEECPVHGRAE